MPHIHELKDFTTSAFILHPKEPKLLLLKHIKIGKWLQPGGHIELDENPHQALNHEIEEETGLTPADWMFVDQPDHPRTSGNNITLPLPFYFNEHPMGNLPEHHHIDLTYLLKAKTDKLTDKPDGASEIAWLGMLEIERLHSLDEIYQDTYEICGWLATKYF
ncbi:MAG: NUDIX domain-containing protein [bacterium]|nr:NUDIX domain-containing protein [bacterium]